MLAILRRGKIVQACGGNGGPCPMVDKVIIVVNGKVWGKEDVYRKRGVKL